MQKVLFFIVFIVFTAFLNANVYSAFICDDVNMERLSNSDTKFRNLNELFLDTTKGSRLHIFGEKHYITNTKTLRNILVEISPFLGDKPCLLLELMQNYSPLELLEKFKEEVGEYEKYLERNIENLSKTEVKEVRDYISSRETSIWYYREIISKAQELGLSLYGVDMPFFPYRGDRTLNERDVSMANRADELLSSGKCSAAIMFVGSGHIAADEDNRKTLVENLSVEHTTYEIAHTFTTGDKAYNYFENICEDHNLKKLPSIIKNSVLTEETYLLPNRSNNERRMLWNDFDYSIISD